MSFAAFNDGYTREQAQRDSARAQHRQRTAETAAIPDPLDREIGQLLRAKEAKDNRAGELQRLKSLAEQFDTADAQRIFGPRVAKALERAVRQGNYSALEALDRELKRAHEEEQFILHAALVAAHEG